MASVEDLSPLQEASKSPSEPEEDEDATPTGAFDYEQSAVAALLGLAAAPAIFQTSEVWDSSAQKRASPEPPLTEQTSDLWRSSSSDDLPAEPQGVAVKRQRTERDPNGAPPPGTCRFQCKYPNCLKMYSSTDAVRKHCRKRHLEWLRKLDQLAAHDRYLPKPALYCRWGSDTELP